MPMLAALICGFIFGAGLVISGMTDTAKVLGFLDVLAIRQGQWDPTLAIVMATALAVALPGFWLVKRRERPVLAAASMLPTRTDIDRPLIGGAVMFGVGWGLVGLCPGPAVANLATLSPAVLVFVAAMIAGMAAHDAWRRRQLASAANAVLADG
jgi:uncharacterized membrane protein YedE/YeeE